MKQVIFLFATLSFLLIITPLATSELIELHNETISISLLKNETCGLEQNLFLIKRINYSTGDDKINLEYEQTIKNENETTQHALINKEIKKYSRTKTSYANITLVATYNISINIENQTRWWLIRGNCSPRTNQQINQSEAFNNTNTINETTNKTKKENHNSTYQTTNNSETKTNCFEFVEIYTDKEVYRVGEQAHIRLYMRPIINSFNITYWIEDLQGRIIKQNHTTSNINEKSYTFKTIEAPEKAYRLKAIFEDSCNKQEKTTMLVLQNNEYEQQVKESTQNNITIKTIELQEGSARVTLLLQKGTGSKTTVNCKFMNDKEKRIQEDIKIKLLTTNQETSIQIPLINNNYERTFFECEGLGVKIKREILFPISEQKEIDVLKINNSSNVSKKENSSQEEKKEVILVKKLLNNKTTTASNNLVTGASISSPVQKNQRKSQNDIALILLIATISVFVVYKRSKPRKQWF